MHKNPSIKRNLYSNYSKSLQDLHHYDIPPLCLKDFWFRKSFFNPPKLLAEEFATRNHIPSASIPTIEILHSDKRWLLLQTPQYVQGFFDKVSSGRIANPFQILLKSFKSFVALTKKYGYFVVTKKMIFLHKQDVFVWINQDIFSNEPEAPLENTKEGKKAFIKWFLRMLENQIKQLEGVQSCQTFQDVAKMLEWHSKLNRGSLTAIYASKQAGVPNSSHTSFEPHELQRYGDKIKGCMSMQDINQHSHPNFLQSDLSNSVTIKESEKKLLQMKVDKGILYDSKDMKYSIYEQTKPVAPQSPHDVRKTKKKFNLTSTSSTLEKFSQKLNTTIGRRPLRLKKSGKESQKQRDDSPYKRSLKMEQKIDMHRSEPLSIASELDGLFEEDEKHQFRLGVEGNHEELEKIAQQIQQILIW